MRTPLSIQHVKQPAINITVLVLTVSNFLPELYLNNIENVLPVANNTL
jgi:hypothetical protein